MTINGKVSTQTIRDDRARSGGAHGVVLTSVLMAGDGETWPAGLVLAMDDAGKRVPYAVIEDEALGVGDGESASFSLSLANSPVEPGSVIVTASNASFVDDGCGRLWGEAGSGVVNYSTGSVQLTMTNAPDNLATITADYAKALAGVLDEERITVADEDAQALAIIHGQTIRRRLKVGVAAQTAPDSALLARLEQHGIFAV